MSAEPPSAWEQACPRSVRLAPEGMLVPASTLRVLLRGDRRLPLLWTGHAFEPWLRDGARIVVAGDATPRPGALVLCDRGGWGDLLRLLKPRAAGDGWIAALDAFPRRRTMLSPDAILGTVVAPERACRPVAGRLWSMSGAGSVRFAWRRIECAPAWDRDPADSVLEKYRSQVAAYRDAGGSNLAPEHLAAIARHARPQDTILVLGCGAGGEVVHLARAGYRVTGVDALPEMIDAARRLTADAGVTARLEVVDLRRLDLSGERYRAVYLTPLLYSFLAGRDRRIGLLTDLRSRLEPGGCLLFSVHLHRGLWSRVQTRLAARRRSSSAWRGEPGDWYTWYLKPDGTIGFSYVRRFAPTEIGAEVRAAGFATMERFGSHFLASDRSPA